jgi:hypothetical protein
MSEPKKPELEAFDRVTRGVREVVDEGGEIVREGRSFFARIGNLIERVADKLPDPTPEDQERSRRPPR